MKLDDYPKDGKSAWIKARNVEWSIGQTKQSHLCSTFGTTRFFGGSSDSLKKVARRRTVSKYEQKTAWEIPYVWDVFALPDEDARGWMYVSFIKQTPAS
jgi:hypothetical protein